MPQAWSTTVDYSDRAAMETKGWHCPDKLPGSLDLVDARRGGGKDKPILHLSYSDGLASVSLFEQRGRLDAEKLDGYRLEEGDGRAVYVRDGMPQRVVWSAHGTVFTLVADAPALYGGRGGGGPAARPRRGSRDVAPARARLRACRIMVQPVRLAATGSDGRMSDDTRPEAPPPASEPQADVPWWSQPSGGSWDTPSYVTRADDPAAALAPGAACAVLLRLREHASGTSPARRSTPSAASHGSAAHLPRVCSSRSPSVIALLAGGAGGAAGYLLAEREDDSVTVEGTNLGTAPARSVERPANSIAGVAAKVLPSVVQIKVETANGGGTGSGFVLDDDGYIVTNNHVVADAGSSGVTVSFADGTTAEARVVGTSGSYDLAVLKVNAKGLKALPLGNSDSVVVGDPVIAIGSPLGLSGTVTSGIVSAKDRPVTAGETGGSDSAYINAIQTDAAINPGNSGGPLVNLDGEVVGVNSAIATLGGSLTGQSGSIGVGFAIPINQARRTVEQIIDTGEAQFPIIGASLDGAYDGEGARIASSANNGTAPIVPGGPAERAGLEPGDVIVAIDGKPVADSSELIVAIRSRSPGDTITLTVRRDGDEQSVKVTLGSSKG